MPKTCTLGLTGKRIRQVLLISIHMEMMSVAYSETFGLLPSKMNTLHICIFTLDNKRKIKELVRRITNSFMHLLLPTFIGLLSHPLLDYCRYYSKSVNSETCCRYFAVSNFFHLSTHDPYGSSIMGLSEGSCSSGLLNFLVCSLCGLCVSVLIGGTLLIQRKCGSIVIALSLAVSCKNLDIF